MVWLLHGSMCDLLAIIVYSGGLLGFLVGSALCMLAHLLLFLIALNDRVCTVALDTRALLLLLLLMILGLSRRLWDSFAHATSCTSTTIAAS